MKKHKSSNRIVFLELVGFSAILAISWFNELFGITYYFFNEIREFNLNHAISETLIIFIVAVPIIIYTKRLEDKLFYLDGILRVCAWCSKVRNDEHWVSSDEYFYEKLDLKTSHSICPTCYKVEVEGGKK